MQSSDKTFLKYLLSLAMMLPAATASAGTSSAAAPEQSSKINAAPDLSGKLAKLGQVNAKAANGTDSLSEPTWLQIIWAQIIWAQLIANADGTTTERKEIHKEFQTRPSAKDALQAVKGMK